MTNTSNTPNWSNTVVRNPDDIVPEGTPLSRLGLPYGGPLFILGKSDEVSDGDHTFGELYAKINELTARLGITTQAEKTADFTSKPL